jgi:molybdopterin-guanine dinucleotide biosynthesis protein A
MEKLAGMTGIVLAGGNSRRMGRDKAWLSLRGRPLVSHQAGLLATVFSDVRISAKQPARFRELAYPIVCDRHAGSAAIFGLEAALREAFQPIFVLAVDLPRVPPGLIRAIGKRLLAGNADCVVPRTSNRLQTVCAAYRPTVLPALERMITEHRLALKDLAAEVASEIWEEEGWQAWAKAEDFRGLNTPEDYETLNVR